jgi:hypothetical protein
MNNDRELLEQAAKAYFDDAVVEKYVESENYLVVNDITSGTRFAPLTDDGDALRLAVKLKIDIGFWLDHTSADNCISEESHFEDYGDDPYAATRRAIVRAAAEIGRTM